MANNKSNKFWTVAFFLIMGFLVLYLVYIGVDVLNTRAYCQSIGYEYHERVGEGRVNLLGRGGYFNCCNITIHDVIIGEDTSVFVERTNCIAGGKYPAG